MIVGGAQQCCRLKKSTATDEDEVDWKEMAESDWPALVFNHHTH